MEAAAWNICLHRVILSALVGAFASGLVTVALVFTVSRYARGDRVLGLLLAGIIDSVGNDIPETGGGI